MLSDDGAKDAASVSTLSENDTPVNSRLRVSLKPARPGPDPYMAALSDEHEIASHHVLTLTSKMTRLGTTTYSNSTKALGSQDQSSSDEVQVDNSSYFSKYISSWVRGKASYHNRSQSFMPLLTFRNPWESFHSPGLFEAWHGGLQWGLPEGYNEGGQHHSSYRTKGSTVEETQEEDQSDDVEVVTPDFDSFSQSERHSNIRVTWLGHATTLIQVPNGLSILFDPIFVDRASPSQNAGPIRFTKPPCQISDLPRIDIVCISHNHLDHLSWECMKALRERERDRGGIKIFCPLGNIGFFRRAGFDQESVVEMDWWDEAEIQGEEIKPDQVKIICLPAQHGSGRGAHDQNSTLWASWMIQYKKDEKSFRTYFAGDTGLRSHNTSKVHRHEFPHCPAFREISIKYGVPQLLLLPISVGSSLSYFRSWDPFPRRFSPFPRVEASLTSAIHMDSEDAAHCHQIMSLQEEADGNSEEATDWEEIVQARKGVESNGVTSLAVHFATFVRNEEQTKEDVRDLRRACQKRQIEFVRTVKGKFDLKRGKEKGRFVVSNQGETVLVPL